MTATIVKNIEAYAKLSVEEQYGKNIGGQKEELLKQLKKVDATHADIVVAIDYLTNVYGTLLAKQSQADAARFALLVRALENNRVLSKDTLESLAKQLKAINDEAENTSKEEDK